MRRLFLILSAALIVGCGSSGLQGVLAWDGTPTLHDGSASGRVRNTTSHALDLRASSMRLLDDRGRKVPGRIRLGAEHLEAKASTSLRATWKTGKPVRIDYGAGTLALPSS